MPILYVIREIEFTNDSKSGNELFKIIQSHFEQNKKVVVSFARISDIDSSFVHSAFIELLNNYPYSYVRKNLYFKHATESIIEQIKNQFAVEAKKLKAE